MLGTSEFAFGQTWHALTTAELHSGRALVRLACEVAGLDMQLQNAPRWMIRAMSVFHASLREQVEMLYQYEQPYTFSSAKLASAFGVSPTPCHDAFREVWGHAPPG